MLSVHIHFSDIFVCADRPHVLGETTKEVLVSGLRGRRRGAMGAVVRFAPYYPENTFVYSPSPRVINAEVRQHKSERGLYCHRRSDLSAPHFFYLTAPTALDRQVFNATLASTLSDSLHTMLTYTSSERGRMAVPLITNASGISPFPIKIEVKVGGDTVVA